MHRIISASMIVLGLAVAPLIAQTTPPPARRGAPPPAKPAAPRPVAPKPAVPAAKPATPAAPALNLEPGTYATFTTSTGNFTARLFVEDAPKTVENFVGLATGRKAWKDPRTNATVHRPYFNNVLFHRVIPGFMIQGGDPTGTGMGGPGYEFADEISPKHRHDKAGILSMANHGPNTNGGQFFVTVAPYPSLDGHYSIFGEIVDGLDNVVAISKVPRAMSGASKDRPLTPVVIKTVKIQTVK
jgi:peptidyl-prolyl cis-trans isomerase A (cyclophilin A)